jgi:hypothetical protein
MLCSAASLLRSPGPCSPTVLRSAICDYLSKWVKPDIHIYTGLHTSVVSPMFSDVFVCLPSVLSPMFSYVFVCLPSRRRKTKHGNFRIPTF